MVLTQEQFSELCNLFENPSDSISESRDRLAGFKLKHGIDKHDIVACDPYTRVRKDTDSPILEVYSKKHNRHQIIAYMSNNIRSHIVMSYGCETEYQRLMRVYGEAYVTDTVIIRLREVADALERRGRLVKEICAPSLYDFEYTESGHHVELSISLHGIVGG